MAKDFLEYIDELHNTYCKKNKIKNKNFILYLPLKSITIPTDEEFCVAKSRKSRVLISHNSVYVDLTDYDIINIVCSLDEKSISKILKKLESCYYNNWEDFEFSIERKCYKGKGIDYKNLDMDIELCLEADFQINLGDFIFIFNMVLFKDIVGQKYVKKKRKLYLIENTLIKYISLIKYYGLNDTQAKKYLDTIGYPLYKKEELLAYKMKVRKYDGLFEKNDFEKMVLL